jgi:hypothetical protein
MACQNYEKVVRLLFSLKKLDVGYWMLDAGYWILDRGAGNLTSMFSFYG